MSELLVVAAIAAAVAYLLAQNQDLAERILFGRKVVFGVLGIIFAFILISTGVWSLMLVGGLMLTVGFLWVFTNEPHQEMV